MQHFDADAILGLDIVLWTHYLIKLLERGLIFGGAETGEEQKSSGFSHPQTHVCFLLQWSWQWIWEMEDKKLAVGQIN